MDVELCRRSGCLTSNDSSTNQQKKILGLRRRSVSDTIKGFGVNKKIAEGWLDLGAISEMCFFFHHFNVERARLPAIKGNNYRVISASSLCTTAVVKFLAFTMDKTTPGYFDLRT